MRFECDLDKLQQAIEFYFVDGAGVDAVQLAADIEDAIENISGGRIKLRCALTDREPPLNVPYIPPPYYVS